MTAVLLYRLAFGLGLVFVMLLARAAATTTSKYCAVWREIQPCSCTVSTEGKEHLKMIFCEKMDSFGEVVRLLQNKFDPTDRVSLKITFSQLEDLPYHSFRELNMTIVNLKLNYNDLSDIHLYSFTGLSQVNFLSLADNLLPYTPTHVLKTMPLIKTLDLGRLRVRSINENDFKAFDELHTLVLPGNGIQEIDSNSIPPTVKQLHLGRNKLRDLNHTLCQLNDLTWLFINSNELTSLEDQLPKNGYHLQMIHASDNWIEKLPQDLKYMIGLETLFLHNNRITALDGVLSKLRNLERVALANNQLSMLQEDDFVGALRLRNINLAYNNLTSLNNSIKPLINLVGLNVTHNLMTKFSFEEIRGVTKLEVLDISYNRISYVTGFTTNVIDWESNLRQLRMDHNEIYSLNGSVSGFRNLVRLDVSYNRLTKLQPDDLIGLDRLNMLDISHNYLLTLEETSKTFLPALQELLASYNKLTILDKDFHGLPKLCWADLSHNNIIALGRDLVSKTHCRVHDGIHSDVWGVLKIDLQDNPILCDSALPEILSVMEINHTKITGVANCPTLSEQPVTPERNNFLGYIGPAATTPLPLAYPGGLPHIPQPIGHVPYNADATNQKQPAESPTNHDANNQQNQIQSDQPQPPSANEVNVLPKSEVAKDYDQEPLPYKLKTEASANENVGNSPSDIRFEQLLQERQINKLTSEIEELRAKLEELASENKRLTHDLNQHNSLPEFIPLDQIASLSTMKSSSADDFEERAP